ncbi:hypothetical protein GCM10017620_13750 [Brevundimonas intermedia]|uniref:Uncharacterized protein n=1 Tax=Brevundimonas intermedia TaxID=74315 RepID=A0ABQ5T8B7_9CAUL|nr:hypothetical protein GCM10017620_13750 [Brevundimonas intermedia]
MVQDHSEASARPIITVLTTQSAVRNSATGFIIEASTGVVIQALRAESGAGWKQATPLFDRAGVTIVWRGRLLAVQRTPVT